MRKKIYHVVVHYKWRTIRYVKGVEKPSKKWNEAKYETVVTELDVDVLNSDERFLNKLSNKHKSSNEIGVKVTNVVVINYLCLSNDVY